METKNCKKCNEELPATSVYFIKEKRNKSGISNMCRKCYAEISKQYKATHQKEIKEYKIKTKEQTKDYSKIYKIKKNEIQKRKRCTKCERLLPMTEEYFGILKSSKDGFRCVCKECRKIEYNSTKEYYKDYKKEYRKNHKEEFKKYYKQWQDENKDHLREYRKQWREENDDYIKEYRKNNKELLNMHVNNRASRINKVEFSLTNGQWKKIKNDFDNKCAYCGEKHKLTKEHFVALSKGGEFSINNILPVCQACNSSKHAQDFLEWYPEQPFYTKEREKFILDYLNYTDNGEQQLTIAL